MILPTKHIPIRHSLLGQAGAIWRRHQRPITVSRLWDQFEDSEEFRSFDRFVLALDLLFLLGLFEIERGLIRKAGR